jgi:adenosine deaminase
MTRMLRCACVITISMAWPIVAQGQANSRGSTEPQKGTPEQRTAHALEVAKGNPLDLRAFLVDMPKGAELHYHLEGGIYAESWIRAGIEDHLCVNVTSMSFVKRQSADCASGEVPAEKAKQDQHLYDSLVDAFSMRGFVPTPGVTAHDHFFNAFEKFAAADAPHTGEWFDEVATRAAAQNELYIELLVTPDFTRTAILGRSLGWHADRSMSEFREQLFARGLRDDIAVVHAYLDQGEAVRKQREHCGEAGEAPACAVEFRYIYQVLRAFPPEQVFAQTLLGFEAASTDPRIVGINFVQPEDDRTAMADYALHMRIIEFLHSLYPKVHITLHAGEIAPGLVPPDGLCCHIRLAVEQAHAERIGHGVDVMYEDKPYDLLKEMAAKHVMVEINLTSNDVILGVAGKAHPFPIYRRFGVPVALSTDDEGVSRIDLTHEYVRAVETYGLTYMDLKKLVRTSMEHNFLPGASLWRDPDSFRQATQACAHDELGAAKPSGECGSFLQSSEKAQQEWELERRFAAFESKH